MKAIVALIFAALPACPLYADTKTIGALQDATIFKESDNSDGGAPGIYVGGNGNSSPRRGLIEFDIAGNLPSGATINSVQLTLTVGLLGGGGSTGPATTISLFALSSTWGEGTNKNPASSTLMGNGSGNTPNASDATWNYRFFSSTPWTQSGGDYASVASASSFQSAPAVGSTFTWSSPGLINDVNSWYNGSAPNDGWDLINSAETASKSVIGFYSREGASLGAVPQLQITYTVPEPCTGAFLSAGMASLLIVRRRTTHDASTKR